MHIRCGSTAYCYLPRKRPDTYRHKKTLGRAPVSPDIAGPCPAEPFQLVPTQLGLISAGIDQLRACESPPKRGLLATYFTYYCLPRRAKGGVGPAVRMGRRSDVGGTSCKAFGLEPSCNLVHSISSLNHALFLTFVR